MTATISASGLVQVIVYLPEVKEWAGGPDRVGAVTQPGQMKPDDARYYALAVPSVRQ